MTTKKILLIVISIVVVIGLLVVVVVGGIIGFAFYSVGHSEAAVTAKVFLRENDRLKQDIGEIKDFGSFVTGNVNVHDNDGEATLNLKVIGERRAVNASVNLSYRKDRGWRVTGASYKDESGQTVDLLNIYESQQQIPIPLGSV
jgi:hypothetical protein